MRPKFLFHGLGLAALASSPAAAVTAAKFGTAVNTSLRSCNGAGPVNNCPGGQLLKAVRPGSAGSTFSSGRLEANVGTAQAGSYATGSARLRGIGLPEIRGSAFAAGNASRLVGGAQAWQSFTYRGTDPTAFSLGGQLHFVDSRASPVNELLPGGSSYFSFIAIWDAAAFPVNNNAPPFFNLPAFGGDAACNSFSGLLGYGFSSGPTTGGSYSVGLTTSACAPGSLTLHTGQEIVVHANVSLFVNRGGFVDASRTFTTFLDPALGQPAIAALRSNLVPGSGGVPEPASWALLIAGFGLTGAAMRRAGRLPGVRRSAA